MTRTRGKGSAEPDLAYHRREWTVQRVGWAAMALFLLAAIAGLFGSGPVSRTRSGDPARGSIDYERFARYGTETPLSICAAHAATPATQLMVAIPRDYLDSFAVESIVPEARSMRGSSERIEFVFDITAERSCIEFRLQPTHVGRARGLFSVSPGTPLPVSQFIYP